MTVIGKGRRGEGEIILGEAGSLPDVTSPLAPLFAYGAIETADGPITISLREVRDGQISVEIVSQHADELPAEIEELRRWTYSEWSPGEPCPQCRGDLREVPMRAAGGEGGAFVLAVCPADKRLWVFDAAAEISRLIPVTNFYNELMLHKHIRDPRIALESRRFFAELGSYSDADLTHAFFTYNNINTKVPVSGPVEALRKEQNRPAFGFLKRLLNR
jgi:hypothetical protein